MSVQVIDYVNAMTTVTAWATQVTQSQLPPLMNPPKGYAEFARELVSAKGDAINWSQSIIFQTGQVPTVLAAYDGAVQSFGYELNAPLDKLEIDPNNLEAQQAVRSILAKLSEAFGRSRQAVTSLTSAVMGFSNGVAKDSAILAKFAAVASAAEGGDKEAIEMLQQAIEQFQQSIDNQKEMMTLEKWLNWDLNIFLGVAGVGIGLIFTPLGTAAGVIIGVVFAVATVTVTTFVQIGPGEMVDPKDLEALQKTITNVNAEVGELNSQIAAVQSIAATFAKIGAEGSDVAKSVQVVTNYWAAVQSSVTVAFDSITSAQSAQASKDWPRVRLQSMAASAAWREVLASCAAIRGISYKIAPQTRIAPLPTSAA